MEAPSGERRSAEPPPNFDNITPASLVEETDCILSSSTELLDRLAKLPPSEATFATLIRPIVDDANRANIRLDILGYLLARTSPDAAVRKASREAQKRIAAFEAAKLVRRDIADLVCHVFEHSAPTDDTLDAQDWYVLARIHGEYARSGAGLHDAAQRARLEAARAEVNDLLATAQNAITDANDGLWLLRTELKGLEDNWLSSLKVERDDEGSGTERLWVPLADPHYSNVLRNASYEKTRRKLYLAKQKSVPENVPRLDRIILLRYEIAQLLGFENHAAAKMTERMARSVQEVQLMLGKLRKRLEPLAREELKALLELKKQDVDDQSNASPAVELFAWDRLYYDRKQRSESYAVDTSKLPEYFEVSHTLQVMLGTFEKLFGMEFEKIQTSIWHESVTVYAAWDSPEEGGQFLGYLYLDIYSRPGKYRSAYHMPIQKSFLEQGGTQHYPVSVLSCSFAASTASQPSLLQHGEIKMLFHELGHAIHNLASRTKYCFSSSKDYVEIPSILLENWIWIPEVLVGLGKHFTYLGFPTETATVEEHLPRSLAESVARTKTLNQATNMLAVIQPALFDLGIYTSTAAKVDTTQLWNETKSDILPFRCALDGDDNGFGQAGVSHLFRNYDVGYYAYAMARVYAADLFVRGFAGNPMNPVAGRNWRYSVLQHGSSLPEADMLEEFLGRKLDSEAIYRDIEAGLHIGPTSGNT